MPLGSMNCALRVSRLLVLYARCAPKTLNQSRNENGEINADARQNCAKTMEPTPLKI